MHFSAKYLYFFILLPSLIFFSCRPRNIEYRQRIDLSGEWQFAMDTDENGESEQWYLSDFEDSITLPGTMDLNKKGFRNTDTTTLHLNRLFTYEGPAWYKKKITVPEDFAGKKMELVLERTKSAWLWVDDQYVGTSRLLQSPHRYDVSDFLSPGEHTITLKIDNSHDLTPYRETHIFSDETQTNWNGIIGDIFLEARPKTNIKKVRVFPDVDSKSINIETTIENGLNLAEANFTLIVDQMIDGRRKRLTEKSISKNLSENLMLQFHLGDYVKLWDEYNQPLYELTVILEQDELKDSKTVPFGMRSFETQGTQFAINDRITFLRGKHDAAVFPETGHTPTDVESWIRVFEIAKSWGINHYRFHSYTPPEAAFEAADQTGIYLQTELPFWGGLENDTAKAMLLEEGIALLDEFGNHPSLVMFSHGNEIWSGHDNVEDNIKALKNHDPRPLYAMGSNNNIGYVWPREVADFRVSSRTPSDGDQQKTHTRMTHAFVDSDNGGILNTQTPSTDFDYSFPVSEMSIPLISHEIGQYQIYPDYKEIDKYKGPVRAWNLELFREDLKQHGMLDQDSSFQKASGAWSALGYKAEMEAAIRTQGMAGFQLLDLQDFPGQGTALVGVLDVFMDDKEVVSKQKWLQSCNDVVLLGRFKKFVWTTNEKFSAHIEVANYSNKNHESLKWTLYIDSGEIYDDGQFDSTFEYGGIQPAGSIYVDLSEIKTPQKLILSIEIPETDYQNEYPVWVYPPAEEIKTETNSIIITDKLSSSLFEKLENGASVLLFPDAENLTDKTLDGLFPPNFWNYEMFKGISESNDRPYSPGTLGLLMDPEHPLFNSFPTDFHTNWQWFSIVKASHPFILDKTKNDYLPVIQVIDNLQRNHKLGLVFEFKVGNGILLVSMVDLRTLTDNPEARQFYASMLDYMNSDDFQPGYEINREQLTKLLSE